MVVDANAPIKAIKKVFGQIQGGWGRAGRARMGIKMGDKTYGFAAKPLMNHAAIGAGAGAAAGALTSDDPLSGAITGAVLGVGAGAASGIGYNMYRNGMGRDGLAAMKGLFSKAGKAD
jgi:hypothetical protein